MNFDAAKVDSSISQEQSADYWRERAECLEEWVCELLGKNQALRMDLQMGHSQHHHREEIPLESRRLGLYRSTFPSVRPAFRRKSPELGTEGDRSSCPRKECAEIRESVVQSTLMNEHIAGGTN